MEIAIAHNLIMKDYYLFKPSNTSFILFTHKKRIKTNSSIINMKFFYTNSVYLLFFLLLLLSGCATLTSDPMTPISFSFGDGSSGECSLSNKRGSWSTEVPATVYVRRSDDVLKFDCVTEDGREATGSIASTVSGKIVASAVFLDFGITDAITDKHREYTPSFVIPVKKGNDATPVDQPILGYTKNSELDAETDIYDELEKLDDLRNRGIISDDEFEATKKKILDSK